MDSLTPDGSRPAPVVFGYTGETRALIRKSLKIFIFSIVTLTLYRFWGRTEVRRYLWSKIVIDGDQLDYTGTGRELFLGFLVAIITLILPLVLAATAADLLLAQASLEQLAAFAVIQLIFAGLLGAGIYQAWRYRLSRTVFRGIRCTLKGSAAAYAIRFIVLNGANILLLGWLTPVVDLALTGAIVRNAAFGDRPFRFEAKARHLYGPFILSYVLGIVLVVVLFAGLSSIIPPDFNAVEAGPPPLEVVVMFLPYIFGALALTIIVIGLSSVFYMERRLRVMGSAVRIGDVAFTLDAHFLSYLRMRLGNLLIVMLTLGFGIPIAEHRTFRYIFRRLRATGTIAFDEIGQATGPHPRIGEGLAEAFGFGNV